MAPTSIVAPTNVEAPTFVGWDQVGADERVAFFEEIQRAFRNAATAVGEIKHTIQIADATIQLQFAGSPLADRMMRTLSHLTVPNGPCPDLTIMLFGSQSTHTRLRPLAGDVVERLKIWGGTGRLLTGRREVIPLCDNRIRTTYRPGPRLLNVIDLETNQAVYWIEDVEDFPYYMRSYPLTFILGHWLRKRGLTIVHSAVIGSAENGILLTNKGSSGKSTTVLNSVQAGLNVLGDDYCALSIAQEKVVAHSLFNIVKIKTPQAQARFFPRMQPMIDNWNAFQREEEVALISLQAHFPTRIQSAMPIKAIVVPVVVSGQSTTTIKPISRATALSALAPSSLTQMAANNQSAFRIMGQLVRRLPCYALQLGADIDAIPRKIERFLAEQTG